MLIQFILLISLTTSLFAQQPSSQAAGSPQSGTSSTTKTTNATDPVLLSKVDPVYPEEAKIAGIQGQAVIAFTVAEDGSVKDVVAVSGDQRLVDAAIRAVKDWKYQPSMLDGKPIPAKRTVTLTFAFKKLWERTDPAPPPDGTPVRVRVSQGVLEGLLKHKETPQYPKAARDAHVQGSVVLQALIDYDGRILSLGLVSGPRGLVDSAVDSVKNWQYRPFLLNRKPVQVETLITINFALFQ